MKTLLRAAYVFPADQPLIQDGAVVFDPAAILSVGAAGALQAQYPDAVVNDLGDSLVLPAFINPHTHLELTNCSPFSASSSPRDPSCFPDWILSLRARLNSTTYELSTKAGIDQCLRFGVATVGDISQQFQLSRPILARSRLRAVSYAEVLGLAGLRPRFEELLSQACSSNASLGSNRSSVFPALTPHAPYTVDLPGYRRCLAEARNNHLPLATHLAETPFEEEFLEHHSGLFRDLWNSLGNWSDPVETYSASPIRFASATGLLDYPTLLAHVNYCTDDELQLLAAGRASVVYCPRTHAYFGHPPHRFQDMLAAGINVAVGTDSCASSPDLNPLEDLRLVHQSQPDIPLESLLRLITLNAARALQLDKITGSLSRGKSADLSAFAIRSDQPLQEIFKTDMLPNHLWINGASIY